MPFKRMILWSLMLSCVSAVVGNTSQAMMEGENQVENQVASYDDPKNASQYMKAPKPDVASEISRNILFCGLISDSKIDDFPEQDAYFIVNTVEELVNESRAEMFVVLEEGFAAKVQKDLEGVLAGELSSDRQERVMWKGNPAQLYAVRKRINTAHRMVRGVEKFSEYIATAYGESGNTSAEQTIQDVTDRFATLQSDLSRVSDQNLEKVFGNEEAWQKGDPTRRARCARKCQGNIVDMAISEGPGDLKNFFVNITGKINNLFGENSCLNKKEKLLLSACLMEEMSFVFRNTQMVMDAFHYQIWAEKSEEQDEQIANDKMIPKIIKDHAQLLQKYYFNQINLQEKEEEKKEPHKLNRMKEEN